MPQPPSEEAPPLSGGEFLTDLDPVRFRELAHLAVDQLADYLEGLDHLTPLSQAEPGRLVSELPEEAPMEGEPLERVLADVERLIVPGLTHWAHPRFFAYFTSSGSAAGILGEILTAGFNVNAMLWRTSPAATELEFVACRWLGRLMGLPDDFDGHINDTASSSTLVALAAAREALNLDVRRKGLAGRGDVPRLTVYGSSEAHSSVEKAVVTLGLGQEGYRKVPTDQEYRMDVPALERMVEEDVESGLRPCAVVATVGTTASTSVDPVKAVAAVCARRGLWLHVDAAHGGALAVVPEWRWVLQGAELADSLVVNPHKWLFTPLDCSVLYVRRPEVLRQAFSLVPSYLGAPEDEGLEGFAKRNLMDLGISLGRRMRALKLWFVLRAYGQEGLRQRIRQHVRMAHWLRGRISITPGWELCAPVTMATVCFRHRPGGEADEERLQAHNQQLMAKVNRSGEAFISHAVLGGRFVLRASVGGIRTRPEDVARLWDALLTAAGGPGPGAV